MTTTTDFTGITYASDGEPEWRWNTVSGPHSAVIVTYSFVESADIAPWEAASYYDNDGYTSFTQSQRANFRDALAVYERAAGIIFVEVASSEGMINAMNTSGSGWGGWANTASSNAYYTGRGELIVDNSGDYEEGSYGFQTMLHELGHAMGLEHPWEGNITLDSSVDDQWHTVMTYNTSNPSTDHLGNLDIAAMQFLYGAASATAGWQVAMVGSVLHVTGSAGADRISGVRGLNDMEGGAGADRMFGRHDGDTLHGGFGADTLSGSGGSDLLLGDGGNDRLYAFDVTRLWVEGTDTLSGGAGADSLYGGYYTDSLLGDGGADVLYGSLGADTLRGGLGDDRLFGGQEADAYDSDLIYGDAGRDLLRGGLGNDTAYGGADADMVAGEGGADRLYGGDGNDALDGGTGADTIAGGAGDDRIVGGPLTGGYAEGDLILGEAGADVLRGGRGADTVFGGTEADFVAGNDGSDALYGGFGADTLEGGVGWDTLRGEAGNDVLRGGTESDALYGGAGDDRLYGGTGYDSLYGGSGNDVLMVTATTGFGGEMSGGTGADRFVFVAPTGSVNYALTDFAHAVDTVDLTALHITFADLQFQAGWFRIGSFWVESSAALQMTVDDFTL